MSQKIQFENHFSKRVFEIIFPDGFSIHTKEDLSHLKKSWQNNLKSWHSPYTCVFDLRNFKVSEELQEQLWKLLHFFEKFHMKKIVAFKEKESIIPEGVFFDVYESYEDACQKTNLSRSGGLSRNLDNLRDRIQIENDFHAHVIEVSFLSETELTTADDVQILKSKIKNILRQWHTPYSILFNCLNLKFSAEAKNAFLSAEKYFKGFFCKNIIGYSPREEKTKYPFVTYRSRHLAAGSLEGEGAQSGSEANCRSRKSSLKN